MSAGPALKEALQLTVHQEAVLALFLLRQLFVFLFSEEAIQGEVVHVFLKRAAFQVKLAIFVDKGFAHAAPLGGGPYPATVTLSIFAK
jgi:hypothetical protein